MEHNISIQQRLFSCLIKKHMKAFSLFTLLLNSLFSNNVYAVDMSQSGGNSPTTELSLDLALPDFDSPSVNTDQPTTSLFDVADTNTRQSYYQAISKQYYKDVEKVEVTTQNYISVDYKSAEINDVFSNYLGVNVSAYKNQWVNVSGGFYVLLNEKEEFTHSEQNYYLPAFAGVNLEHKNQLFKYMGYSLSFMAAGAPKQALVEEAVTLEQAEDKYEIILEPKIGMFFPLSNKTELGLSGGYMMMDKNKATTSYGIDFRLHW